MKPVDAFAEVATLLTETVKQPYRDQPMTEAELDTFVDRVMLWAQAQKKEKNGNNQSCR